MDKLVVYYIIDQVYSLLQGEALTRYSGLTLRVATKKEKGGKGRKA